jgi:hypothetical protein
VSFPCQRLHGKQVVLQVPYGPKTRTVLQPPWLAAVPETRDNRLMCAESPDPHSGHCSLSSDVAQDGQQLLQRLCKRRPQCTFASEGGQAERHPEREEFLFSLFHSSPSVHGITPTLEDECLHRIMAESGRRTSKRGAGQNGRCANSRLSQRRGSPQQMCPKLCPYWRDSALISANSAFASHW